MIERDPVGAVGTGVAASAQPGPGRGRVDGLTVLRGIAIALVLLRHAAPDVFGGAGVVGVTVFFALSGWLITGVLLADLDRCGRVYYRRFYFHRILRLYPALLLLVVGLVLVGTLADPLDEGPAWRWAVAVALTYTADLPLGLPVSTASTHLWTLAVEEQFYLLWPFLLVLASRRALRRGVLVAVLLCWAAAVATVVAAGDVVVRAYFLPTSWFVALAVGGLARTLDPARLSSALRHRTVLGATVVVLAGTCLVPDLNANRLTYLLGGPVIAVCTVVLVVAALPHQRVRSLPARALVGLGTVSYATYLWNWPLVTWAGALLPDQPTVLVGAGAAVASVGVATVSWYALERPVGRARARWGRGSTSAPAACTPDLGSISAPSPSRRRRR
ncbi:acyltransferase 3 [Kineococcus radiotolerans SRS30216 = ATCC BAA-149]|uniref:Acyltransferase 3 n=1 Tax=Kineococcus radiotolerans (strain ATCC BAA-149 / DSM 14245 / SRS30216) TaxID=266940 RepID=A6WE84_KINRD|nr:acyltransferase 3 [Kineococcus radiotolerans SRS30216 = ATCC BAA-149]